VATVQAQVLTDLRGLTGPDLVATFVECRVLPLANCAHKIVLMSGPRYPTRFSTKPLSRDRIREQVNIISKSNLPEEWEYGMVAFSRRNRAPQVSLLVWLSLPAAGSQVLVADYRLVAANQFSFSS
jgi:hypothetical protein